MKHLFTFLALVTLSIRCMTENDDTIVLEKIEDKIYQGFYGTSYKGLSKHMGLLAFEFIGKRLRDEGEEICLIIDKKTGYALCGTNNDGKPSDYQIDKKIMRFVYFRPQDDEYEEYMKITQLYDLMCDLELNVSRKKQFLDFYSRYFKKEMQQSENPINFVSTFEKDWQKQQFLVKLYDPIFNKLMLKLDVDEINRITHENAKKRCGGYGKQRVYEPYIN